MELKFLGNGSAFADTHNNAYFIHNKNLYFIDLSMYNIKKAEKLVTNDINEIFIVISHMHSDHASGIGLFAQWCYFVKNKKPIFVCDTRIRSDLIEDMRATGVDRDLFKLISIHSDNNLFVFDALEIKRNEQIKLRNEIASCLLQIVPTKHAENLIGKCFGFVLRVNGKIIVYSGDTATLDPFINKLYNADEFYCEMSFIESPVHLYWNNAKKKLLEASQKCKIYLMHIDDFEAAEEVIKGTPFEIVKIANIT